MGALQLAAPADFRGGDARFEVVRTPAGDELLVLDRLLRSDGNPIAIAQVAEPLDNVHYVLRQARTILIWSAIGGALLVGAASFFIAGTAIDPIKRLTTAMAEIGSDQLDRRIPSTRTDEVGRLAAAFNAMLARLEEAFARERQFIADASHELKTPLTVINANAQLLKRWGNDDPAVRSESLDAIVTESEQLAGMVSGMLTLAKADSGDQIPKEPLALDRLLTDVVTHARSRAERKALTLEAHLPAAAPIVVGDESLLRQLFSNLVDNAIKFTETRPDRRHPHRRGRPTQSSKSRIPESASTPTQPSGSSTASSAPTPRIRGSSKEPGSASRSCAASRGFTAGRSRPPHGPAAARSFAWYSRQPGQLQSKPNDRRGRAGYHGSVGPFRSGAGRWIAAGVLFSSAIFGCAQRAGATTTSFDVTGQAVVQVIGHAAPITIRTWNRNTVQIDWPDGAGFNASRSTQPTRPSFLIPTVSVAEVHGREGTVITTLLPEDFPVPKLAPGMHDVVRVVEALRPFVPGGPPPPALTLMIPESTGLVNVRSDRGAVTLNDYHGTTIAADRRGRMTFNRVSGDAFVQPLNGSFYALDSSFDRLRIRSNRADQVFDACRVKQIEATTLTGNIVFDNGSFEPGLARFESDRGSIALGRQRRCATRGAHPRRARVHRFAGGAGGAADRPRRDRHRPDRRRGWTAGERVEQPRRHLALRRQSDRAASGATRRRLASDDGPAARRPRVAAPAAAVCRATTEPAAAGAPAGFLAWSAAARAPTIEICAERPCRA